jgi:tyrosine-protein kinase Etk/Wzc
MQTKIDLIAILRPVYRRRKSVFWVVLGVSVLTAGLSLLLPNYYKSTTIFYAASTDVAKPEFLFGQGSREMNYYGKDVDIDRIFTVGNSVEMMRFLVDSFQLAERYGFTSDNPRSRFKLYETVQKYFDLRKTKYDALELSFEDKDPEFARDVANRARLQLDIMVGSMIKQKQLAQISALERSVLKKQEILDKISDSLSQTRQAYGIISTTAQAEMLANLTTETESKLNRESAKLEALKGSNLKNQDTIKFIAATVKGLERELSILNNPDPQQTGSLSNFNSGRTLVERLEAQFYSARENLGYDMENLKRVQAAYQADISFLHLVAAADTPLVKSRPKRSIFVITTFFVSLFFCILGILLYESVRNVNWKSLRDEDI